MNSIRSDFRTEMDHQNEVARAEVEAVLQRLGSLDPRVLRRVAVAFRMLAVVIIAVTLGVYLAGTGEMLDMVSIGYMCLLAVVGCGFVPGVSKDWRFGVIVSVAYMVAFILIPVLAGVTALAFHHVLALALGAVSVFLVARVRLNASRQTA